MTALIRDDRAWGYPGGVARLLVWQEPTPDAFTLAVVSQDQDPACVSVTDAMGDIVTALTTEYGDDVQVVQHTLTALRHEFAGIHAPLDGGLLRWLDLPADDLADDIGLPKACLLTLLEAP